MSKKTRLYNKGMPGKKNVQVYYDRECLMCSRFIVSLNNSSRKVNFVCKPIQTLDKNDVPSKEFHIITQDGKVYRKFDALIQIGEMYPKWRFFSRCARLPILYQILSFGYDIFADHRYGISKFLQTFVILK